MRPFSRIRQSGATPFHSWTELGSEHTPINWSGFGSGEKSEGDGGIMGEFDVILGPFTAFCSSLVAFMLQNMVAFPDPQAGRQGKALPMRRLGGLGNSKPFPDPRRAWIFQANRVSFWLCGDWVDGVKSDLNLFSGKFCSVVVSAGSSGSEPYQLGQWPIRWSAATVLISTNNC